MTFVNLQSPLACFPDSHSLFLYEVTDEETERRQTPQMLSLSSCSSTRWPASRGPSSWWTSELTRRC
jgi:hypothetical protein